MASSNGSYDAVIVGAGPGGATAAAFMARAGLRVMLVDKASFPRDKICGDAISGKSVDVLRRLELIDQILTAPQVKSRSEEHTSELQSRGHLVCRLLLEKKKQE